MDKYMPTGNGGFRKHAGGLLEFARWFERSGDTPFTDGGRVVARTDLPGGVLVSTVFLGYDHAWGSGGPVLFETMIFGGGHSDYQERFKTHADALAGHAAAVKLAKGE